MTPRILHPARVHVLLRKEAVIAHDIDGNNPLLATFDASLRALRSLARGRLVVVTIVVVIIIAIIVVIVANTWRLRHSGRGGRCGPIGADLEGCE
jgi:hypothetical protein